jgi:tetratricopeptide (TPR) repeat protein
MARFWAKFLEKQMAGSNEGFAAFREAKNLYFAFVKAHGEDYGVGEGDESLIRAYELYQKSADTAQEEERYRDVATTHTELGKVSELLGDYRQSVEHRRRAIDLFESLPQLNKSDLEVLRDSYMFMALSLYYCDEFGESKEIAEKGLEKYRMARDAYGIEALKKLIEKIEVKQGKRSASEEI